MRLFKICMVLGCWLLGQVSGTGNMVLCIKATGETSIEHVEHCCKQIVGGGCCQGDWRAEVGQCEALDHVERVCCTDVPLDCGRVPTLLTHARALYPQGLLDHYVQSLAWVSACPAGLGLGQHEPPWARSAEYTVLLI